jgi:broad specificity phosphatase PhoE
VFDRTFLTGVDGVTEVLLIRHAEQVFDPEGVVGDFVDPQLSERGCEQARLAGEALSVVHLDAIFCSPLKRAMETARAISQHHRQECRVIEDLSEVGIFQDVPPDKTAAEFFGDDLVKATGQRMLNERSWDVFPLSESSHEFRKRAINAVESVIVGTEGERIAIVCHGGVINAYIGHIIGSRYDMFFRPAHTSINVVATGEGRRVLRSLNDVHHLRVGEGEFLTY